MRELSERDVRLIGTVQAALDGQLWNDDAAKELRAIIESGPSEDKLQRACDIAVAFVRLAKAQYED